MVFYIQIVLIIIFSLMFLYVNRRIMKELDLVEEKSKEEILGNATEELIKKGYKREEITINDISDFLGKSFSKKMLDLTEKKSNILQLKLLGALFIYSLSFVLVFIWDRSLYSYFLLIKK